MTGCTIGWIKPKNGGARVRLIGKPHEMSMVIRYPWGEITFRHYDGKPIERNDALWLLRCAESDLLKSNKTEYL